MGIAHDGSFPLRALLDLSDIDRPEPLAGYQDQLLDVISSRLARGDDVLAVTAAIADANNLLTRRLLDLAQAHLGPPPCRYAWLVLGSQGRGEQVLSSDQDSAIAYESGLPADEPAVREYFAALSGMVVNALALAGLPLCAGGYMATNWCRPMTEFQSLFHGWIDDPQPHALLWAQVFLDVQAGAGDLPIDPLERLLVAGGRRGPFRAQMARAAVMFRPSLTWWGGLRTTRATSGSRPQEASTAVRTLDVKASGTAPIVLLARLYALAAGSAAHSTVERLEAATGTLSPPDTAALIDAYRYLTGLRLRHQLEQIRAGFPADNRICPEQLPMQDRRRLRTALHVIRDVQEITARNFATHTVS
jgi:CBS domain-containing protein